MQSKTYIQTSRFYTSPSKGNLGWKEVPMPKLYKQDLPLMKMYQVENIIIEQSKNRNHDN